MLLQLSSQRYFSSTGGNGMDSHSSKCPGIKASIKRYLNADLSLIVHDPGAAARIKRRSRDLFRRVIFLEKAERLMHLARQAILEADARGRAFPNGRIWWAGSLTEAKGRMKRHWQADPGGIYLCIAIYPALLPENWQLYNNAAGLSICQVLREWGADAHIRWLNDILIHGKKVAGILAESVMTPRLGERYLLTGIGINVNQQAFPSHLESSSTSLFNETGRRWPVRDLGTHFLSRMALNFSILHDWEASALSGDCLHKECSPVIPAYRKLCRIEKRRIRYGRDLEMDSGQPATALRIMEDGSLKILMEDGTEATVNTGEIRYEDWG